MASYPAGLSYVGGVPIGNIIYNQSLPISCSGAGEKDLFERIADACLYPFRTYLFAIERSGVGNLVSRIVFVIGCIPMLPLIILGIIFNYLSGTRYGPRRYNVQLFFEILGKYFEAPLSHKIYFLPSLKAIAKRAELLLKQRKDLVQCFSIEQRIILKKQLLVPESVSLEDCQLFFQKIYPHFLLVPETIIEPVVFIYIVRQVFRLKQRRFPFAQRARELVFQGINIFFSNFNLITHSASIQSLMSKYSSHPCSEEERDALRWFFHECALENESGNFFASHCLKCAGVTFEDQELAVEVKQGAMEERLLATEVKDFAADVKRQAAKVEEFRAGVKKFAQNIKRVASLVVDPTNVTSFPSTSS